LGVIEMVDGADHEDFLSLGSSAAKTMDFKGYLFS
jgi:hypothetical protein